MSEWARHATGKAAKTQLNFIILFGLTALHSDDFFILSESTCTRGHPYKLFLPRCLTDVRKYFFCHRIVKVWNELPIDIDFSSIDLFQRALDGFNFTAYCDIYIPVLCFY